jgi:hypothetical protein
LLSEVPLGGDILEVVSPLSSSQPTSTSASRHLSKRGEGGYMIIMQSASAIARREYLKSHNLAKVIFEHRTEEGVCIQYHPKGIKGGVIPELDSHFSKEGGGRVSDGMKERFAPWHACGPLSGFEKYGAAIKRHSQLHLMAVTLRLAPEDTDVEGAVRQWESLFGVGRLEGEGSREVAFTNAIMEFCEGRDGEKEGLRDVVIGVEGNEKFQGILKRAREEGLEVEEDLGVAGDFQMLGVRWVIILMDEGIVKSRL